MLPLTEYLFSMKALINKWSYAKLHFYNSICFQKILVIQNKYSGTILLHTETNRSKDLVRLYTAPELAFKVVWAIYIKKTR